VDKWAASGPSLCGATPEARAKVAALSRFHDIYVSGIQARAGGL
jgi:hypothetical protein